MLTVLAPAKLNLVLEVIGKRNDGYHEISSLMHTINMNDTLSFELDNSVIYFECTDLALQTDDNLVIQAAKSLLKVSGYKCGAKIYLEKRIPSSSGLGGGSSDAAATLLALNELWGLELKTSDLIELAAELGSDIPFFIHKGMAIIKGKGEKVVPLPSLSQNWYVLLIPPLTPIHSKTRYLYSLLTEQHITKGGYMDDVMNSWSRSGQVTSSLLFNVFDSLANDAFPGIDEYWKNFEKAGAVNVHLAGSGPTLFTSVDNESQAITMCQCLCDQNLSAFSVSTTP